MELNSTTELPKGNGSLADGDKDFAQTIEESRAKIQSVEIAPTKRRRGRPRKPKDPVEITQPRPSNEAEISQGQAKVDVSEFLRVPLLAISKIPASRHNIPELAFSESEAAACAESLNQCLQAFVPNVNEMSPKTAAVIGAFTTFGAISFTKYQIFSEITAKRILENQKAEAVVIATNTQENIGAGQFFAKQAV